MLKKHKDVGELLSTKHAQQKAINRSYLSKVLENLIYLARQGLPMRGNWVPESFEILLLSHVVLFCYVFCNMYVCLCSFVCSVRGTLA